MFVFRGHTVLRSPPISPGFLNDHNPEFAWTHFDCRETISCVLCTHREDQRLIVREFVALLREHYNKS